MRAIIILTTATVSNIPTLAIWALGDANGALACFSIIGMCGICMGAVLADAWGYR